MKTSGCMGWGVNSRWGEMGGEFLPSNIVKFTQFLSSLLSQVGG